MPVHRNTPKRKAKIDQAKRVNGKGRKRSDKFKVVDASLSEPPPAPGPDSLPPPPIIQNPNEPPGTTERIVLAQIEALGFRIQGHSYPAIARRMNIATETAYNYINDALEKSGRLRADRIEIERELSAMQIDEAITYLWAKIKEGDPSAFMALVRGNQRKADLYGLDAPKRVAPTTPDGSQAWTVTVEGKVRDDGRVEVSAKAIGGLLANLSEGIPGANPPLLAGGETESESSGQASGTPD